MTCSQHWYGYSPLQKKNFDNFDFGAAIVVIFVIVNELLPPTSTARLDIK